jgi:hypothetical protein
MPWEQPTCLRQVEKGMTLIAVYSPPGPEAILCVMPECQVLAKIANDARPGGPAAKHQPSPPEGVITGNEPQSDPGP